jgi:hypothetical protein
MIEKVEIVEGLDGKGSIGESKWIELFGVKVEVQFVP